MPRSARAYNPLVRREGRLGLGFPKKNFKVPARVCVTCPEMPGSARGSDALGEERSGPRRGGREGRLGLGFPKIFQSPSSCLCNLSRNARVRQGLRRPRRNAPVPGEEGGAPGTWPEACQFGEAVGQEPCFGKSQAHQTPSSRVLPAPEGNSRQVLLSGRGRETSVGPPS